MDLSPRIRKRLAKFQANYLADRLPPVDHRFREVERAITQGALSDFCDDWVREAVQFFQLVRVGVENPAELSPIHQAIGGACRLIRGPVIVRELVEALLLAGESPEQIASTTRIRKRVIVVFSRLFFDVSTRELRNSWNWNDLADRSASGFKRTKLGRALKRLGFLSGAEVLNDVVGLLRNFEGKNLADGLGPDVGNTFLFDLIPRLQLGVVMSNAVRVAIHGVSHDLNTSSPSKVSAIPRDLQVKLRPILAQVRLPKSLLAQIRRQLSGPN